MPNSWALESLMQVPSIYRYRVSPDGRRVAFVRDTVGVKELFVHDTRTDSLQQITDGDLVQEDPGPIMWAPDGGRIYFQQQPTLEVHHAISTVDMEGCIEVVHEEEGHVHLEDVSPSGRFLLYHLHELDTAPLDRDLFLFDREADERVQLTDYAAPVRTRNLFSPDETQISYQVYERGNSDAFVMAIDGESRRKLGISNEPSDSRVVDWHPDSRCLLVLDDGTGVWRPGVYDLAEDEVRWYGCDEFSVLPWAFVPEGTGFLAGHYRGVTTVPALYTLDGQIDQLPLDGGVAGYPTWVKPYPEIFLKGGEAVLMHTTESQPAKLVSCDLDTYDVSTVVPARYGEIPPDSFVDAEYITYRSADELEIGALLYRPNRTTSPAIMQIHGGPQARSERNFEPDGRCAQFFVSRGYAVLQPNFRGSTGRGREFRMLIEGDAGGGDAEDVAAGARWLGDQDWIDSDRIGVFGQSYGGFGAFTQMTKYPDLWTAGIAWNGSPSGSAYNALDNIEALEGRLLLLAGENDPNLDAMRNVRNVLVDTGQIEGEDFEFNVLEGEGHYSRDTQQGVRRFRIIEAFLEKHL